jgi:hypothetical protein
MPEALLSPENLEYHRQQSMYDAAQAANSAVNPQQAHTAPSWTVGNRFDNTSFGAGTYKLQRIYSA